MSRESDSHSLATCAASATIHHTQGGISNREELQKYREEWSSDTPLGASMRFKTSQNAATEKITTGKFKSKTLRKLPGTPLAVERLRQRSEKHA